MRGRVSKRIAQIGLEAEDFDFALSSSSRDELEASAGREHLPAEKLHRQLPTARPGRSDDGDIFS